MTQLANGLSEARHHEDALIVEEANLSMLRRLGASEDDIIVAQSNLATTYRSLGLIEKALSMRREQYLHRLKLSGEEDEEGIREALCYALDLIDSSRFEEGKALLHRTMPVARRVLGDTHEYTIRMRWGYARALHNDPSATLENLRDAVETFESVVRLWTRVFGAAHPETPLVQGALEMARKTLARATAASESKSAP